MRPLPARPAPLRPGTSPSRRATPSPRRSRGISLVELVVTLALMGLLAMLAAPLAELSVQRAKERQLRTALLQVRKAIDDYKRAADAGLIVSKIGGSTYPPSLDSLVGVTTVKSGDKKEEVGIVFLRQVPRDPFADENLPANVSWGLRASNSPPDKPAPGDDVFDIFSRAEGKGLNGVPYREW
jgi:general secretion pathway protein G